MSKYATRTEVSPEKSMAEIQALLTKYGAKKFGYMQDEEQAAIAFEMSSRRIRFIVKYPSVDDCTVTESGRYREYSEAEKARVQAIKQRWRALLLAIKAKLEAVEVGIETFDEAFMPHIILPSGQTMSEWAVPQIEQSYNNGKMPPLLGYDN